MMQSKLWFSIFLLTFFALISPVTAHDDVNHPPEEVEEIRKPLPTKANQSIRISKAEFGVFRRDKGGKITFIPTTRIPLNQGIAYGWRLRLKDYKGEITWKEVFRLPTQPLTWGTENGDNFSLTPNGKAAVIERTEKVKGGVIQNSWTLTPGDPPGRHIIEVYIKNRRVASFEFEVVPLNQQRI